MALDRGTRGTDRVTKRERVKARREAKAYVKQRQTAPAPVVGENAADKAYAPRTTPPNIETRTRPTVRNRDGSVSTVRSIGITDERGREVLIPTVVNGRVVSNDEAIRQYQRTGQHLGIYPTRAASERAAQQLHEEEARRVAPVYPQRGGSDAADAVRNRRRQAFEEKRNALIAAQYGVGGPKRGVSYQGDVTNLIAQTGYDPDFIWWAATHPIDRIQGQLPARFQPTDRMGNPVAAGTLSGPGGFFARRAAKRVAAREAEKAAQAVPTPKPRSIEEQIAARDAALEAGGPELQKKWNTYLDLANKDRIVGSEWDRLHALEDELADAGVLSPKRKTAAPAREAEAAAEAVPTPEPPAPRAQIPEAGPRDLTPAEIAAKRDRIIGEQTKLRFLPEGDPLRAEIQANIARLEDEVASGRGVPDVRASAPAPPAAPPRRPPEGPPAAQATPEPEPQPRAQIPEAEAFMAALPGAKQARVEQDIAKRPETASRFEEAERLAKEIGGVEGHEAALKALSGEYPKIPWQGGMATLDDGTLVAMLNHINDHPGLTSGQKVRARQGLIDVLNGKGAPQKGVIKLWENAFGVDTAHAITNSTGFWRQAYESGLNVLNVPRALQASIDLSAPFRQGLSLGARHPIIFAKNFKTMLKAAKSENFYQDTMDNIYGDPYYPLMKKGGLAITDLEGVGANREELFPSDLAELLTGGKRFSPVRMSGRAYTAFLNKFRADVFKMYVDQLQDTHRTFTGRKRAALDLTDPANAHALKSIASWVNHATGRGSIKALEGAIRPLNTLLFSPRLMLSRIQLLNPVYYAKLDPFARKQALRGALQLAGAIGMTLELAKLAGARVNTDRRNSDFGKIRVGDTRVDIAGGYQQYIVLAERLRRKESVSAATGGLVSLEGGFAKPSRASILGRFGRQKLAPVPGLAASYLTGETFEGDPFSWKREVPQLFAPIGGINTYETYQESGPAAAVAGGGLGGIGFGVQTFPDKPKPKEKPTTRVGKLAVEMKEAQAGARILGIPLPREIRAAIQLKSRLDDAVESLEKQERKGKNVQTPPGERFKVTPRQKAAAELRVLANIDPRANTEWKQYLDGLETDKDINDFRAQLKSEFGGSDLERWHSEVNAAEEELKHKKAQGTLTELEALELRALTAAGG